MTGCIQERLLCAGPDMDPLWTGYSKLAADEGLAHAAVLIYSCKQVKAGSWVPCSRYKQAFALGTAVGIITAPAEAHSVRCIQGSQTQTMQGA